MTTYDIAFEEAQYRAVASRAAKYYQEKGVMSVIPLVNDDSISLDDYKYRYTYLGDPIASFSGVDWSAHGEKGRVLSQYTDIDLYTEQMNLYFGLNEYNKFGSSLIADKRGAIVDKWGLNVDYRHLHGARAGFGASGAATGESAGMQLCEGMIGQLTSIQNLDGTDSTLNVKGDIWYAINTMIDGIPFGMRQEGGAMTMITDEYVAKEAFAPDRIYQDSVEGDFIRKYLMSDLAPEGRRIGTWRVSNNILCEASDNTDGDNADTADTLGTHSRIMLFVPDIRWCGRIISRGFSLVGEDTKALGTEQIWGWKGRAYWFNTDCAEFSEAIQW
jgi:hypothetical protein